MLAARERERECQITAHGDVWQRLISSSNLVTSLRHLELSSSLQFCHSARQKIHHYLLAQDINNQFKEAECQSKQVKGQRSEAVIAWCNWMGYPLNFSQHTYSGIKICKRTHQQYLSDKSIGCLIGNVTYKNGSGHLHICGRDDWHLGERWSWGLHCRHGPDVIY